MRAGLGTQVARVSGMRHLPRLLAGLLTMAVCLGPAVTGAAATTIDDLTRLKAAKPPVSDDVLIALIESDGSVFHLTADDIVTLRQKGFSNELLVAMLVTATRERDRAAADVVAPAPLEPDEPVETIDQSAVPPADIAPTLPVNSGPGVGTPYYVQTIVVEAPRRSRGVHPSPVIARPPAQTAPPPVYWGWGGQRRPDSYAPANDPGPGRNLRSGADQRPSSTPTPASPQTPTNGGRGGRGGGSQ